MSCRLGSTLGCTITKRTTHLLSGMAVGALASLLLGEGALELVVVGGLFGILPDLDLVLSPLWPRVHRSAWSHSLLASVLMALALYLAMRLLLMPEGLIESGVLLELSAITAFAAAFLHAAEDSLTLHGCRLLYPISRRRWRGPVRYDDLVSNAMLSIVAAAVVLFCAGRGELPF